jgi:hypothetical protein
MASSNSISPAASFTLPTFPQSNLTKLQDSHTYIAWLAQVSPILRSNDLIGIVDESEPCPTKFIHDDQGKDTLNPNYILWNKKDQYLLSWLNTTLSEKLLATVYGLNTSKQVWTAMANRFASQSWSSVANLKRQLQNLHQGSKNCTEYLQSAKSWQINLQQWASP